MADDPDMSSKRLTISTLLSYGISDFPVMLASMPMMLYLNVFYAGEIGLDLIDLGNMLLFARIFDLVTDPLVGYLSDHTRTRWGRRRPWMVASLPFLMLGLYKVLIPDEGADIWYLFTWMMVMWLGWTMLMIPYYAGGAGLTADYDDRTRVTGWRAAMGSLGQLAAIGFPVIAATWFELDGFAGIMRITAYAALILMPASVLFTVSSGKVAESSQAPNTRPFHGLRSL